MRVLLPHIIYFYEVGCCVNYFVAYLGNFKHSPSYLYTLGILKVLELYSHYLPCIHVVDMLSRDFLSPTILFRYCFLVFVMAFLPLLFFLVYANLYFCRL